MFPNDLYIVNSNLNKLYKISNNGDNINYIGITEDNPRSICVSQDKITVLITNKNSNSLSIFRNDELINTRYVGNSPSAVCEDNNGNIYICCYLSNSVVKLDKNGNHITTIMVNPGPYGICCDSTGTIWVSCFLANKVDKIVNNQRVDSINVANNPQGICCDPMDGIWVACYGSNVVSYIYKSNKILDIEVGKSPVAITSTSQGVIYVCNYNGENITKISKVLNEGSTTQYHIETEFIDVGVSPNGITIDQYDNIYVTNSGSNFISIINNNKVISNIELGFNSTGYGDFSGCQFYNVLHKEIKNDNAPENGWNLEDLNKELQQAINSVINKAVKTDSELVKYENDEFENVKSALDFLIENYEGIENNFSTEMNEIKIIISELENRVSSLEEFGIEIDSEISEKITKLEGYFSEDGKANSSLDSDKLGGKDPSYYASTEQLNSVINGISWKNPVLNITKLKEINSPQEGWTVSIEDTNKIYRFDTSTEIESDSDDETKIKANDGTTGSWLLLGTVVYNKATQEQDGLMSKEDKTTVDNLGSTYLSLTGGEVTGEITANKIYTNNNILVFNNVEEMKASNKIKQGYTVQTLGFYEAGDGGGANYIISNDIGEDEVDEASIITLQSGLYGKLIIKDFVNAKQMGIKGDENENETNIIKKILINNNIKEVYFPKGIYVINDLITINRPIRIIGENKENTVIVAKDFLSYVSGSLIWIVLLTGSNIIFENIQLQQNLTDTENKGMLLGFKNSQNIIFKNCFIFQNEQDFGYVDLNTNNKNITFENCEFKTIIKTKTTKGTGCVMVREGYTEKVTENIYFNNCIFDHESADESIGVWDWFGTVKNVFFNNCTFNDANGTSMSQHFITLNLKDKSVFLNNCIINRSGDNAFSIIKGGYGSVISNCIFNLNVSSLINGFMIGSHIINNCIIKNSNLNKLLDFNQLIDTDSPGATEGFYVYESKINGFRNFNNGKLVNCELDMNCNNTYDVVAGSNIEFTNCNIYNINSSYFNNNSGDLFKIINCVITGIIKTTIFANIVNNTKINIQGNVINLGGNFSIYPKENADIETITGIINYLSYNNSYTIDRLGDKVIIDIKNINT